MKKCLQCGACCRVFGIYEVSKKDAKKISDLLIKTSYLYPNIYLMETIGFQCVGLSCSSKCKIYEIRPSIYRRFKPGSDLCKMAREQYYKNGKNNEL